MACNEFKVSVADPYHCKECKGLLEDHVQLPSTAIRNVPVQEDLTFITVVLDRSGSMSNTRDATIDGFNEFLNGQKLAPGRALFTLVQFDDEYEVLYDGVSIPTVAPRDLSNYIPRGNTALLDAMGKAMAVTTEKIQQLAEKPARVICVILTDGGENSSQEYKKSQVSKMIEERKELGWQFLFLGTDEAGIRDASTVALASNSYKGAGFDTDAVQYTSRSYSVMTASISQARGMSSGSLNASADTLADTFKNLANSDPVMSGSAIPMQSKTTPQPIIPPPVKKPKKDI